MLHGEVSGSEGASLDTVVLRVLKMGCVECCNSEQSCVTDPVGAEQTCTAGGFTGKVQRGVGCSPSMVKPTLLGRA